jgi:hypothetical protein
MAEKGTVFRREWAMPSADTFSLAPVSALLDRWLDGLRVVVDPFARNSQRGTHRNDLNPETNAEYHMEARAFCDLLVRQGVRADAVLFDPPYSPRQITECYASIGRSVTTEDTQNARLYREVRAGLDVMLRGGGIAISFGWNSGGFGKRYWMEEVLLVPHGGAHNDTIAVVERKMQGGLFEEASGE